LGKESHFKGKMRFSDSVRISGRFDGEIEATGFLFIEDGAVIHADLYAETIIVGGEVHGNITATGKLEMLPSARIYGNVRSSKLRIADGVVFEGRCEMLRSARSLDIFAAPVDQLKESSRAALE
jgi:cytoskeletal protein CcmA (bactofilin family)